MTMIRRALITVAIAVLSGCAAQRTAEEYGSNMAEMSVYCPGDYWFSRTTNEGYCVLASVKTPGAFVIAENTAEVYGAAMLTGLTLGLSTLFDGDTQEKWFRAAREYTAQKFGPNARVINFREQRALYKAFVFEVMTADGGAPTALPAATTPGPKAPTPTPAVTDAYGKPSPAPVSKNDFKAGQLARSIGCEAPKLLNATPSTETYQTACPGGQYKLISCEFTNCRVMQ